MDREKTGVPPTLDDEQLRRWSSEPDAARRAVDAVVGVLGPILPDDQLLPVAVHGTLEAAAAFEPGRGVAYAEWALFYAAFRLWEHLRRMHRGDGPALARIRGAMFAFLADYKHSFDAWNDTRESTSRSLHGLSDGILFDAARAGLGFGHRGDDDVIEVEGARRAGEAVREVLGELRPEQRDLLERCAARGEPVRKVAGEAKRGYRAVLNEHHALLALCGARLARLGIKEMPPWRAEVSGSVFDDPPDPANDGARVTSAASSSPLPPPDLPGDGMIPPDERGPGAR